MGQFAVGISCPILFGEAQERRSGRLRVLRGCPARRVPATSDRRLGFRPTSTTSAGDGLKAAAQPGSTPTRSRPRQIGCGNAAPKMCTPPAVLERTRYGLGGQVVFSGTGYDLYDGKAVLRSTTFGYDLMGHKVAEVSAGGSSQLWRFNAQGQLYRYVDTGGASTISEYEEGARSNSSARSLPASTLSRLSKRTTPMTRRSADLVRDEFTQEANLIVSERVRTVTQTRYDLNGLKVAKRVEVSRDGLLPNRCKTRRCRMTSKAAC